MANTSALDAIMQIEKNFAEMVKRFQRGMQTLKGRGLAEVALAKLRRVPGPPIHPIRFDTDRQRRAFFASKGFGRGIPARRGSPPAVTQGWNAEFIATDEGGIVALSNPEPHMQYVQGFKAQGFHKDTGWVQVEDVMNDFYRESADGAVQVFYETCDPLEGV